MSLLSLISVKNKRKIKPEILEASFEDLLKDYNFEEKIIDNLEKDISNNSLVISDNNIDNNNNSDVKEDSPFNDSDDNNNNNNNN